MNQSTNYNQDFWNDRYSRDEFVYGESPNRYLKEKLQDFDPGKSCSRPKEKAETLSLQPDQAGQYLLLTRALKENGKQICWRERTGC